MTRPPAPSGKQYVLERGGQRLVVTEVGAAIRRYVVDGGDVLDGWSSAEMCSGARGQTFIPWPNRIADGAYRFEGEEHQLPLTEPAAGNAIHGLTRWSHWRLTHENPVSIRLTHDVPPQPGYPFALRCRLTYRLGEGGLEVETRVSNVGCRPCPYATGAHPYLRLDADRVDELEVQLAARTWLPTDDRGIPVGERPVEGTDRDFRTPRPVGATRLDTAFTDLTRGPDGRATVSVRGPGGRRVELWTDEAYGYVELFTGDTLTDPRRRRRSLGVEPMTAAPNAFRSGAGLLTLEPGATATATWGMRPSAH